MAAWLAVCVTIAALVYAWRQFQSAKHETEDISQPNVAMFMEPSATDWHLVELVVKNFGQKPAYGIKFEFATPPTVPRYESADADNYVDIVPLKLPAEIPYLAPVAGMAHGVGLGAGPQAVGRVHRLALRRAPSRSTTSRTRPGRERRSRSGISSARPRCWTGRRCTPSSGWSC